LIDDLTSPSKKLLSQAADWNRILSGELLDPAPHSSNPEGGKSALPVKRLTSVLLHYATFLRRAKGDLDLAEIVLRKAAEVIFFSFLPSFLFFTLLINRSPRQMTLFLGIVLIILLKKLMIVIRIHLMPTLQLAVASTKSMNIDTKLQNYFKEQ
jgi:hypothetical protein